uniref:DC1 domain-containing protein n=1 Tax=Nelumbo nucifera TaxID=4432 RepID=A0A822ZCD0_NELNU|nr:TPA_asm: hypothetical protein HUJ06_000423 [Nelumbo nucifera]
MGKLNYDPVVQHFSHPHPLEICCNHQQQQNLHAVSCSGCKLKLASAGSMYTCKSCNFFISHVPRCLTTSFIPLIEIIRFLQLQQGYGFSYHCQFCSIDIHTACASMPLSLTHQSHYHPLNLTFTPPYNNRSFNCDICNNVGSNHWLYRFNVCGFDAHLACAAATPPKAAVHTHNLNHPTTVLPRIMPLQYPALGTTPSVAAVQQKYNMGIIPYRTINGPGRVWQGNNNFFNQALQGLFTSASQQLGQSQQVQGITGGGSADNYGGTSDDYNGGECGGDFSSGFDGMGEFGDSFSGIDVGGFADFSL